MTKIAVLKPRPGSIEPPEDWRLQSPFGFMRFDSSPAGRVVRLADVLRWLEESRSLPRQAALKAFCAAMPHDVVAYLYKLDKTDYAKPLAPDAMFGYMTAEQAKGGAERAAALALRNPPKRISLPRNFRREW